MKVAFYIPNKGFADRDLRNVNDGNPGIGGSEYSAVLIASNICRMSDLDVVLLCDLQGQFPIGLKTKACGSLRNALTYAQINGFDYVIVDAKLLKEHILLHFYNVRFIAWANCFVEPEEQLRFSHYPNLVRIVNVGSHQNDLLRNSCVGNKSTFIFNAVPTRILDKYRGNINPISKRKNNVVYIGSLHKAKGFHCLAQVWPKILSEIPDANLYVIGSAHLYGKWAKLGKWGIAQQEYEEEFMPYLTDENGKILPSVHFMGVMGAEKYDILNRCKVGVPNPWGISETFGYTAVEMELMGCHVTTIRCPGYLDTIYNQGNLYDNIESLSDYVVKLLGSNELDYNGVLGFISQFSIQKITNQWIHFLLSLDNEPYVHFKPSLWRRFSVAIKKRFNEYKSRNSYWARKIRAIQPYMANRLGK